MTVITLLLALVVTVQLFELFVRMLMSSLGDGWEFAAVTQLFMGPFIIAMAANNLVAAIGGIMFYAGFRGILHLTLQKRKESSNG